MIVVISLPAISGYCRNYPSITFIHLHHLGQNNIPPLSIGFTSTDDNENRVNTAKKKKLRGHIHIPRSEKILPKL